jgi:hypothetical protein
LLEEVARKKLLEGSFSKEVSWQTAINAAQVSAPASATMPAGRLTEMTK